MTRGVRTGLSAICLLTVVLAGLIVWRAQRSGVAVHSWGVSRSGVHGVFGRAYPDHILHYQDERLPPVVRDLGPPHVGVSCIVRWVDTDLSKLDRAKIDALISEYGFVPRIGTFQELAMPDGTTYSRNSASFGEHVQLVRAFGFTPRQPSSGRYLGNREFKSGAENYMGQSVLAVQLSIPAVIAVCLGLIGSALLAAGISRRRGRRQQARGFAVVQPEARSDNALR